jgi:hypothetical protein
MIGWDESQDLSASYKYRLTMYLKHDNFIKVCILHVVALLEGLRKNAEFFLNSPFFYGLN